MHFLQGTFVKKLFVVLLLTLMSCTNIKVLKEKQVAPQLLEVQENSVRPEILESSESPVRPEVFESADNPPDVTLFDIPKNIHEAVNSSFRTPLFKERDVYRHPIDTLTFFNIKPSMRVLEVTIESPWYYEILAPYLSTNGQYIMTNQAGEGIMAEWSRLHPEIGNKIKKVNFNLSDPNLKLDEDSSVDAVLTFRSVHKWMESGVEDNVFEAFYNVLKKGGILGIVEHRAPRDSLAKSAKTGYVRELDVIKMAKRAGFKYFGKSEVNGNPKDTKDYPKGVWSLPPYFANQDKDREKYLEIGESDRMTLKFIKP